MSFDVNVLSSKPVIKPAASMQNDGGGGNLGYMYQGRQQKKEENRNIFDVDMGFDTFGAPKNIEVDDYKFSLIDFVMEIIEAVKSFLRLK